MNLCSYLTACEKFTFLIQRNRQEQERQDQTLARQTCCGIRLAGPGTETRMGDVIVMVMIGCTVAFVVHRTGDGEDTEKEVGRRQEHGNART